MIYGFLILGCNAPDVINPNLTMNPDTLEVFGRDLISTPLYERDLAISLRGDEIIFTVGDYRQNIRCLVSMKNINDTWEEKIILPFSGKYQDIEPFISPHGDRLFFASNRPLTENSDRNDYNIWSSQKLDGYWREPIALSDLINTEVDEFFPSVANNGNLYFTSTRSNGIGSEDIFLSQFIKGSYQIPEPLDTNINTATYEFNAYISPDEDLIVFSSYGRSDDLGGGDLYFSKRLADGQWMKSENLKAINSDKLDYCPFVDFSRGNFYFTSERLGKTTGIKSIGDLERQANQVQNGFGDIYRIRLEKLPFKSL
jgi:hypothetical protein